MISAGEKPYAPMLSRDSVLYVDDEEENLEVFRLHFEKRFRVRTAKSGEEALAILAREEIAVLLTDERMPGMSGIDLLSRVVDRWPATSRVIVSAYSDAPRLLAAINRGRAQEYVLKPFEPTELEACIRRGLDMARRTRRLVIEAELRQVDEVPETPLVGSDRGLASVVEAARRAAATDATVLLLGETGTGKEALARLVHESSARASGPFVRVNVGAIPEGTLESELFGHERGAFTGAVGARRGRFELADGGTIFLDEIGDVAPRTQVALLRVLQEKEIERVGGGGPIKVDVRVVAATHRDLKKLVAAGTLREDLYYRLNVVPITVPPLRERREDIGALVEHFLRKHSPRRHLRLAEDVVPALQQYDWPGNVRELENLVQRAVVLSSDDELRIEDFSMQLVPADATERDRAKVDEREKMKRLLVQTGFNCARAAQAAGLPRTTFVSRAKKYGLI